MSYFLIVYDASKIISDSPVKMLHKYSFGNSTNQGPIQTYFEYKLRDYHKLKQNINEKIFSATVL